MTRLAVAGRHGLAVSDIEVRRGGVSYAIDTVRELSATGVSDGRYYADDRIEIINFGPGSGAQGHAANESVPIAGSQAPQFIPCANGGSGENVDFVGGSLHILFTFTVSTNQVSGKFKFQRVFKRHLLTNRSQKRKRQLRLAGIVPPAHHHQIAVLLPYKD